MSIRDRARSRVAANRSQTRRTAANRPPNAPPNRPANQQAPVRNRLNASSFHALPFSRTFFNFLSNNRGKEHSLVLGIGTSGSSDVKRCAEFAQSMSGERKTCFLLMIDKEYTNEEKRRVSLEPLSDLGFEIDDEYQYAMYRESGIYVYLWGLELPTAYNIMQKYEELRDDPRGPYNYGLRCEITGPTRDIYGGLLTFFQLPILTYIYVYNQGHYNENRPELRLTEGNYYRGPGFTDQRRVRTLSMEEIERQRRSRERLSHYNSYMPRLTVGEYFENFCELLYCLAMSRKPVFLLQKDGYQLVPSRLYEAENIIGGSASSRRRRRLSRYSYRKRTL
jgi:hypothetical protein